MKRFIGIGIKSVSAALLLMSAAFLLSPAVSSAQTTSDLQAQIQALLQQIQQLQEQLAARGGDTGDFSAVDVDMKVNNSDGPIYLAERGRVVLTWSSEGADYCQGNWTTAKLKPSGTKRGTVSKTRPFSITCYDESGESSSDLVRVFVGVTVPTAATTINHLDNNGRSSGSWSIGLTDREGREIQMNPLRFPGVAVGNYRGTFIMREQNGRMELATFDVAVNTAGYVISNIKTNGDGDNNANILARVYILRDVGIGIELSGAGTNESWILKISKGNERVLPVIESGSGPNLHLVSGSNYVIEMLQKRAEEFVSEGKFNVGVSGGGFTIGEIKETATPTQPSITVLSPNGGEVYHVGETVRISLISSNIPNRNSTFGVQIHDPSIRPYRPIFTQSFSYNDSGDAKAVSFVIPSGTSAGKYVLYASNAWAWDQSDSSFAITAATSTVSCAGANINGYSVPAQREGEYITVQQSSRVSNGTRNASTTFTCRNGSFVAGPETANIACDAGYTSIGLGCVAGPSSSPSITVTAPAEGRTFEGKAGTQVPIRWTTQNWSSDALVNIDLIGEESAVPMRVGSYQLNNGLFRMNINQDRTYTRRYQARVSLAKDGTLGKGETASSGWFTITAAAQLSPTVLSPNGGESYTVGQTLPLRWSSSALSGNVKIEFQQNGVTQIIAYAETSNSGAAEWGPIPGNLAGTGWKVKISSVANPAVFDESNGVFSVVPPPPVTPPAATTTPSITITAPTEGQLIPGRAGSAIRVQWSTQNWPSDRWVNVELLDQNGSVVTTGSYLNPTDTYPIGISKDQAESKTYRVRVFGGSEASPSIGPEATSGWFTVTASSSPSAFAPADGKRGLLATAFASLWNLLFGGPEW